MDILDPRGPPFDILLMETKMVGFGRSLYSLVLVESYLNRRESGTE